MIDFFQTRMGHTFFEGTMPRIAKALEKIAAAMEKEEKPKSLWDDDHIQFARLLAEFRASGGFNAGQYQDLKESMDLTYDQIDEILERAEVAWVKIKAVKK